MLEFENLGYAQTLAQAIVNTLHEPLLVLDSDFRVLAASVSFYRSFQVEPTQTIGRMLFSLGDGQWDIPALRTLLETIIPERAAMDGFEVEHDFPGLGRRTMLLNARQVVYEHGPNTTILLAFMDITDRRRIEREKALLLAQTEELLRQKDTLLKEMQHRVANSLQIIASILLLKARAVSSAESRQHLQEAHQRVISVAEVQRHLHATTAIDQIDVGAYLTKLCASLASSMVGESQPIGIEVNADPGQIGSDTAVSLGLIVTELVINAIKYAFPAPRSDGLIRLSYKVDGDGWRLTVSDNGIGKGGAAPAQPGSGLGTAIVQSLVKQLGAAIEQANSAGNGLKIVITRPGSVALGPTAA
ncbi:chemotaxis protein methyltransferase CheR [Hoeflea marina]|uniref:histidine kinase n=1 Tax=Hoeflea marina TaxID=274592 RepID=A0A317PSW7_9HYPH|nr:PAS domain-containing sensor histidine kinase [Hoeflea marina]PWW03714.1 chemotaxis protein methyltransferase CheR [Hoeflea marina]